MYSMFTDKLKIVIKYLILISNNINKLGIQFDKHII